MSSTPIATTRNVMDVPTGRLAVWWVLASEIVIFGGLLSSYVMMRLPGTEPALVMAGGPGGAGAREKNWGIIEID